MKAINFVPLARRRARAVRKRLRGWGAGVCFWCGLLAVVGVLLFEGSLSAEAAREKERLDMMTRRLAEHDKELATTRVEVSRLQQRTDASALVTDHPDWSALLVMLAQERGKTVVLESVEVNRLFARPAALPVTLGPKPDKPARNSKESERPPGEAYLVRIMAVGESVRAAQGFVVRLEEQGLFDKVALIETRPSPAHGGATWFRVDCDVADVKRAPQPPTKSAAAGSAQPAEKIP